MQTTTMRPRLGFMATRAGEATRFWFGELGRRYELLPGPTEGTWLATVERSGLEYVLGFGDRAECLEAIFANAALHA